jgi:hypothetical protein
MKNHLAALGLEESDAATLTLEKLKLCIKSCRLRVQKSLFVASAFLSPGQVFKRQHSAEKAGTHVSHRYAEVTKTA